MTEVLLEDLRDRRKKLLRAKVAIGIVLGGTLAGLFDETVALVVIAGNAFIWACWYATLAHEASKIGRLQLKEERIRERIKERIDGT